MRFHLTAEHAEDSRATFGNAKGKSGFEQKRMSMCASKEEALLVAVSAAWGLAMETF